MIGRLNLYHRRVPPGTLLPQHPPELVERGEINERAIYDMHRAADGLIKHPARYRHKRCVGRFGKCAKVSKLGLLTGCLTGEDVLALPRMPWVVQDLKLRVGTVGFL